MSGWLEVMEGARWGSGQQLDCLQEKQTKVNIKNNMYINISALNK